MNTSDTLKMRIDAQRAYAWKCDFGLCQWAEPTRAALEKHDKPSPEGKIVPVRIISETQYRRLLKLLK